MIVLQPIQTAQTFSVMPRFDGENQQQDLTIRKDGTGDSESFVNITTSKQEYYTDVELTSTILEEGCTYSFEILSNSVLWYRGKIFVTSQNNYTVKHELAQRSYTPYNDVDDNTYVIN